MSHLKVCAVTPQKRAGIFSVRLKWRGTSGTVTMASPDAPGGSRQPTVWIVFYAKYTKLGGLLFMNEERERHFIREALHRNGVPLGVSVTFIGT